MKKYTVLFSDGSKGLEGDFPIAVCREVATDDAVVKDLTGEFVVDPIFNWQVNNNLYGRVMTLVEATTDVSRLKAVKDVFSKELSDWAAEVHRSAREKANGGGSSSNIYDK